MIPAALDLCWLANFNAEKAAAELIEEALLGLGHEPEERDLCAMEYALDCMRDALSVHRRRRAQAKGTGLAANDRYVSGRVDFMVDPRRAAADFVADMSLDLGHKPTGDEIRRAKRGLDAVGSELCALALEADLPPASPAGGPP